MSRHSWNTVCSISTSRLFQFQQQQKRSCFSFCFRNERGDFWINLYICCGAKSMINFCFVPLQIPTELRHYQVHSTVWEHGSQVVAWRNSGQRNQNVAWLASEEACAPNAHPQRKKVRVWHAKSTANWLRPNSRDNESPSFDWMLSEAPNHRPVQNGTLQAEGNLVCRQASLSRVSWGPLMCDDFWIQGSYTPLKLDCFWTPEKMNYAWSDTLKVWLPQSPLAWLGNSPWICYFSNASL